VLPDFPELKRTVVQDASAQIRKMIDEQHPILAEFKTRIQHEGRSMRYEQAGYGEKHEDLHAQSFPIEITIDEVPTLVGEKLKAKLEGLARAVGEHQMKSLIAKHEEATEMTGNRIDGRGRPMDGAMLLEVIETMPVDFDVTGNILPTNKFLTHPDMMPTYRAAIREIENDKKLQSRQRSIVAKQYNEWVDRENRRKLVD
jgi:hypothetical protein